MLQTLKQRARSLKQETFALYLAARHPDTPWYAKLVLGVVVAYVFSPLDLIPDFVPVVGYLDDLILVPLGITLALRLTPPAVMVECRAAAREAFRDGEPVSRSAAVVVVVMWIAAAVLVLVWIARVLQR